MDEDTFIELLTSEVKGLSNYLDTVDYENATDDALRETGWSFDLSTNFQEYWTKQRAKRHLFFYLMTESAHKFKYEQINLQHRFDHYSKLITMMDEAFALIKEENPDKFEDLDGLTDTEKIGLLGTKVDAGFSYGGDGKETTYANDNEVNFFPNEDDA